MSGLREGLRGVRPFRAALAVALGVLTVASGTALLASSGALITGAARRPENLLVLMPLITAVRLFSVSRAALRYAERLVSHDLALRAAERLRASLLDRLAPLAPGALWGARGGELLARLRADVDLLRGVWVQLVAPTVVAAVTGLAAVVLAAVVSPGLALVLAGLLLGLGVLLPVWARRAGATAYGDIAAADAAFGADGLDLLRGLPDQLTLDGGAAALSRLAEHLNARERADRAAARLALVLTLSREAVPGLGLVAALWFVGATVAGGADARLLAGAGLAVLGSFEAVGALGAAWATSAATSASGDRVRALADLAPLVGEPARPAAPPADPTLRWSGVGLTYPGAARPALAGLDLEVAPGAKLALVGPSGAGKSTVLALALRARDPDVGRVSLGGVDLRELSLADLRSRLAWAGQAPDVLGTSLADNLRVGAPDASDARLLETLAAVGLDEVVDRIGLAGWVGERGGRLSAGERARLAVARALVSPADVLLLDEPTAHLDDDTGARLLGVLLADPRAVLLVTHRTDLLDGPWRRVVLAAPAPVEPVGPRLCAELL